MAGIERFTKNLTEEFPEEGAARVLANADFLPLITPLKDELVGDSGGSSGSSLAVSLSFCS